MFFISLSCLIALVESLVQNGIEMVRANILVCSWLVSPCFPPETYVCCPWSFWILGLQMCHLSTHSMLTHSGLGWQRSGTAFKPELFSEFRWSLGGRHSCTVTLIRAGRHPRGLSLHDRWFVHYPLLSSLASGASDRSRQVF